MVRKLFEYMNCFRRESILGPLFKLTEAVFELIVPLVVADMIDSGIAAGNSGYIWGRGAILIALGLLGLAFSITAQWFAARAATGVSGMIRRKLFAKSIRLDAVQLDKTGSAGLLQRLTGDMDKVQSGLNLALRLMLRSPFVVIGAMIMAFTVDVPSAIVFAVIIPLLSIAIFGMMAITVPLFSKHQDAAEGVTLAVKENLEGARVVRAFGREESENSRFASLIEKYTSTGDKAARISALTNPMTSVMINAALIVLIRSGAVSVNIGSITQGQLVALVNYMSQILVELVKLANLIVSVTKALAAFGRVQRIIDLPEKATAEGKLPAGSEDEIVFSDVCFSYAGGADSLSDISFTVKKGQTIGVVGPTGSGKSTLMRLLQGQYACDRGFISVFGRNVLSCNPDDLHAMFSEVAQNPVLFSGSLETNIKNGNPEADEHEVMKALEMAQGSDIIARKKEGLKAEAGQSGRNLSGGQRQRIAIARAFIKNSDVLILDDCASALDMKTDAALRRAISENAGEKTVFIVSQRASSVKNADLILVMEDGRISAMGSHDGLMQESELYKEIYKCQFPEGEAYA